MAEVQQPRRVAENEVVVDRARDFWSRNNRTIMIAALSVILLCGAYLAYKYLVKEPKEKKAAEAIFKAEEYYRMDSLNLALKGDGQFPGFEKVASQYSGTKAGNLAKFYAGSIHVKNGDLPKAVQYLKDFDSDAAGVNARAYKLLADAYADQGKNGEALTHYKKAARAFEADENASSEYLFMAAYFADRVMNDKKQAIELYKEVKQKFPNGRYARDVERYLGQAGVYNTED